MSISFAVVGKTEDEDGVDSPLRESRRGGL
jgi:hypothetical protein